MHYVRSDLEQLMLESLGIKKMPLKCLINTSALEENVIDTARIYNDWIPGEIGRSERVIGDWIEYRGGHDDLVIMTKGAILH